MQVVDEISGNCKAGRGLSNSAKLLAGYMKATGVTDAKALSAALGIPLRTIQRLKLEASSATDGAENATDGGAIHAISATDGVSGRAIDATGGALQKEISPTPPKEKLHHLETSVEINNSAQQPRAREVAAAALPPKVLADRLIKACNGSLDNPVNCMGLLSVATPLMWLREGADLELDVIPTLEAAGKKYHGKRIRDWNYFTPMVAEAKAKRQRGLPSVEHRLDTPQGPMSFSDQKRAKAMEVLRQIGAIA